MVVGLFLALCAAPAEGRVRHHRCLPCDRAWGRVHHWRPPAPPFRMSAFEVCVANHESGAPEDPYNPVHIDWRMRHGGYEGGYSWLPSTWRRQRFAGYPWRAVDASPRQQVLVFRAHENAGEWPQSIPACGG